MIPRPVRTIVRNIRGDVVYARLHDMEICVGYGAALYIAGKIKDTWTPYELDDVTVLVGKPHPALRLVLGDDFGGLPLCKRVRFSHNISYELSVGRVLNNNPRFRRGCAVCPGTATIDIGDYVSGPVHEIITYAEEHDGAVDSVFVHIADADA